MLALKAHVLFVCHTNVTGQPISLLDKFGNCSLSVNLSHGIRRVGRGVWNPGDKLPVSGSEFWL